MEILISLTFDAVQSWNFTHRQPVYIQVSVQVDFFIHSVFIQKNKIYKFRQLKYWMTACKLSNTFNYTLNLDYFYGITIFACSRIVDVLKLYIFMAHLRHFVKKRTLKCFYFLFFSIINVNLSSCELMMSVFKLANDDYWLVVFAFDSRRLNLTLNTYFMIFMANRHAFWAQITVTNGFLGKPSLARSYIECHFSYILHKTALKHDI